MHFKHPLSSIQKAEDANDTKTASCGCGSVLSREPRQTMVGGGGMGLMMIGLMAGRRGGVTEVELRRVLSFLYIVCALYKAFFTPDSTEYST